MSANSNIAWTEATWSPTVGCSYLSDGCRGCYAARESYGRLRNIPVYAGLATKTDGELPRFTGEVRLLHDRLDQPLHWKRPRRIFVNSMSDLFHNDVPDRFIADVFAVMALARRHQYQVLTKRPQRMARLLGDTDRWLEKLDTAMRAWGQGLYAEHVGFSEYPPNWVWLGTSIESDAFSFRADHVRATPAGVRFLSLEPLLGPLPSLNLDGIGWVIVGGESGPQSRPMDAGWVRDIRDRCADANVPFFMKQAGAVLAREWGMRSAGHNIDQMPEEFRVRQYPMEAPCPT